METFAEQREHLLQSIDDYQKEVGIAVHEFTDAAESKLDVRAHIRQFPLTWVIGAALVGIWLGSHGIRVDGAGRRISR